MEVRVYIIGNSIQCGECAFVMRVEFCNKRAVAECENSLCPQYHRKGILPITFLEEQNENEIHPGS